MCVCVCVCVCVCACVCVVVNACTRVHHVCTHTSPDSTVSHIREDLRPGRGVSEALHVSIKQVHLTRAVRIPLHLLYNNTHCMYTLYVHSTNGPSYTNMHAIAHIHVHALHGTHSEYHVGYMYSMYIHYCTYSTTVSVRALHKALSKVRATSRALTDTPSETMVCTTVHIYTVHVCTAQQRSCAHT